MTLKSKSQERYRNKCHRQGRCERCGCDNDRKPLRRCSICQIKHSDQQKKKRLEINAIRTFHQVNGRIKRATQQEIE